MTTLEGLARCHCHSHFADLVRAISVLNVRLTNQQIQDSETIDVRLVKERLARDSRLRNYLINFELSAAANLLRPSRICARDHAANPKVRAGSGSAFIKQDDKGDGLIPISLHTRVIKGKSAFRRSQATKCSPASGISKIKYLPNKLLNCSMKNSLRSEYSFRIRLMWLRKNPSVRNRASVA